MGNFKVRYLVARPQKGGHSLFYWWPTKNLQEAGFLPRRLAERTNELAVAIREAEVFNRELDAWRAGTLQTKEPKPGTMPDLIRLYRKSIRYQNLRENSRLDYEQCIKSILAWSEHGGEPPASMIRPLDIDAFYQALLPKAPSRARKTIVVLRAILEFGVKKDLLKSNPAARPDLRVQPGRDVVWSADEIRMFCAKAREMDRSSLALATLLAVNIGQRQGDILKMAWSQYDGRTITLRQQKTGKRLAIPVVQELKLELDDTKRVSPTVIISETTGKPYTRHNFSHLFRTIVQAASLREELQFLDLRRTAVVELAEAGCNDLQIGAVTGHSYDRSKKILETYLPRTEGVARSAITLLSKHRKRTK